MSQHASGIRQLFEQLDGPYRHRATIRLKSGSARVTIDSDVRKDAGLELEMESVEIDAHWFNDEQKLVLDLEDFEIHG